MRKVILTTPISNEDIEPLRIGDIIFLSGCLVTGRDDVHHRLLKQHHPLPVDISGKALFHAGPIMKETECGSGKYEVVSIGPTTSMRMEKYEKEFIGKTGLKLIVGREGWVGTRKDAVCTRQFMRYSRGCAVLAAKRVEEVEGVEWLDWACLKQCGLCASGNSDLSLFP